MRAMFVTKTLTVAFVLVLTLSISPNAQAQRLWDWDQPTVITVDVPWEVQGTTLAPGTYLMKLGDLGSTRTIVRIFNEDRTQLMATVIGITAYPEAFDPDPPVVHFYEAKAGSPRQLHTWYPNPGGTGVEFLYPAKR